MCTPYFRSNHSIISILDVPSWSTPASYRTCLRILSGLNGMEAWHNSQLHFEIGSLRMKHYAKFYTDASTWTLVPQNCTMLHANCSTGVQGGVPTTAMRIWLSQLHRECADITSERVDDMDPPLVLVLQARRINRSDGQSSVVLRFYNSEKYYSSVGSGT